jgi:hypothetical protein
MKITPAAVTHTGVTTEAINATFGPTGASKHTITVPQGTKCEKLADDPSHSWVVSDLSFIDKKNNAFLYSDADIYGIKISVDLITDIKEIR